MIDETQNGPKAGGASPPSAADSAGGVHVRQQPAASASPACNGGSAESPQRAGGTAQHREQPPAAETSSTQGTHPSQQQAVGRVSVATPYPAAAQVITQHTGAPSEPPPSTLTEQVKEIPQQAGNNRDAAAEQSKTAGAAVASLERGQERQSGRSSKDASSKHSSSKDKESRSRDKDHGKDKGKQSGRDNSKSRNAHASPSKPRASTDKSKSSCDKPRLHDKDKDNAKEKSKEKGKDKEKEKDKHKDKERSRDNEKDKDKGKDKDKDKKRSREKESGKSGGRSRSRQRSRSRRSSKSRSRSMPRKRRHSASASPPLGRRSPPRGIDRRLPPGGRFSPPRRRFSPPPGGRSGGWGGPWDGPGWGPPGARGRGGPYGGPPSFFPPGRSPPRRFAGAGPGGYGDGWRGDGEPWDGFGRGPPYAHRLGSPDRGPPWQRAGSPGAGARADPWAADAGGGAGGKVWGASSGWDAPLAAAPRSGSLPDERAAAGHPATWAAAGPDHQQEVGVGGGRMLGRECMASTPQEAASWAGRERRALEADGPWRGREVSPSQHQGRVIGSQQDHNTSQPGKRAGPEQVPALTRDLASGVDRELKCWYYLDPQEQTQGPCSIAQFQQWLQAMAGNPRLKTEYEQFKAVSVWREGMAVRVPLVTLLSGKHSPPPPGTPSD